MKPSHHIGFNLKSTGYRNQKVYIRDPNQFKSKFLPAKSINMSGLLFLLSIEHPLSILPPPTPLLLAAPAKDDNSHGLKSLPITTNFGLSSYVDIVS